MLSDWLSYFYPQLTDPWQLHVGIFNLPWIYVLLHPLSYLGPYLSAIILQLATLVSIWFICNQMKVAPVQRILIYLSPPVLWGTFLGQFDGIYLLAFFLPFWIAPISALIKPQVNIGAIRKIFPLWPYLLASLFIISAYLIWKWPLAIQFPEVGGPNDLSIRGHMWNWSIWPFGLLLIPLLIFSKDIRIRMGLSPFLFPYIGVQSLIGPLISVSKTRFWLFMIIWSLMWYRWWLMVNTGVS